jgi:thymidylate synthase (FAD)
LQIINARHEIITPIDRNQILKSIELAGRTCYRSDNKITEDSASKFVEMLIKRGHEAILEHQSITVKFICDRGIANEITRHRLASFAQESTRFCNYSKDKFNNEISVIYPCFLSDEFDGYDYVDERYLHWKEAMEECEQRYFDMLKCGATPQEARSVLPNSTKTELIMTMNMRELRHFLRLRTSKEAHSQMREITIPLLSELTIKLPELFGDIEVK